MRQLISRIRNIFRGRRLNQAAPRKPHRRPEFEALEDRCVPANASSTLRGVAFIDINRNGVRNAGEALLPGARVELVGTTILGNDITRSLRTNSQGAYRFLNILPGNYRVRPRDVTGFRGIGFSRIHVDGGELFTRNVRFGGQTSDAISLRQLLSSSTDDGFHPPPGTGRALANYRPNNHPTLETPIGTVSADTVIDLAGHFSDPDFTNSRVRIRTSEGDINVVLFDKATPRTVANFFNYIKSNRYDNSIFHRRDNLTATDNEVLQGGGFRFQPNPSSLPAITTDPPVQNEFSNNRPNVKGTLAMAKLGGDPNSATSQFFFNNDDNSTILDGNNNGGFTVFGKILGSADQAVIDRLVAIPTQNQGGAFTDIPLKNAPTTGTFPANTTAANYALIRDVVITKRDEFLRYQVISNSNPSVASATIRFNRLSIDVLGAGNATIRIRAFDRYGASVDALVHVANQAPTATVSLDPDPPTTNSTLTATATKSDPDGNPVTLTYVWKVDNVVKKTTANTNALTDTFDLSLAGNGDKGQVVTVEVTPNDGSADGALATDAVTVANSAPVISLVDLAPDPPGTTETMLTATVSASDADNDPIFLTYVWKVNSGAPVQTTSDTASPTDVLDLFALGVLTGDTVSVDVTPNDGTDFGTTVSDSVVVV